MRNPGLSLSGFREEGLIVSPTQTKMAPLSYKLETTALFLLLLTIALGLLAFLLAKKCRYVDWEECSALYFF